MFAITYKDHDQVKQIPYRSLIFSGGEIQVFIDNVPPFIVGDVTIDARIHNANQIMELVVLTDALRRATMNNNKIHLILPYMPYARQDRVMNPGESLAVKVFANILNSMDYASVTVYDAHSDVTPALINNVIPITSTTLLFRIPIDKRDCVLVSPDAGANKKVLSTAKAYGLDMIRADKMRNTKTGEITGTIVYSEEHIGDRNFLIVDDIVDGGRTFTELADKLKPLTNGKIYLYVTHGIFSKGMDVFNGKIDQVFCPFVFDDNLTHPLLTRMSH